MPVQHTFSRSHFDTVLRGEVPRAALHAEAVPLIEGEPLSRCAWHPALLKPSCLSKLSALLRPPHSLKQPKCCWQGLCTDACTAFQAEAVPFAAAVMEGRPAACMAYGQTGSGKTYQVGGASQLCRVLLMWLMSIVQPGWEWLKAAPQCSYFSQELSGRPMQM